jgi:hypothetical protein
MDHSDLCETFAPRAVRYFYRKVRKEQTEALLRTARFSRRNPACFKKGCIFASTEVVAIPRANAL